MKKLLFGLLFLLAAYTTHAQNKSVDQITSAYIGVKNALVGSNATLAKSRAKELLAALAVPPQGLTAVQQKLAGSYADKLKADSRGISQATDIEQQRKYFESLSANIYSLLSGLQLNGTTLYQQYCPMKKAAWLSESEDIRNPYYGDKMLECGMVKATLKAAK